MKKNNCWCGCHDENIKNCVQCPCNKPKEPITIESIVREFTDQYFAATQGRNDKRRAKISASLHSLLQAKSEEILALNVLLPKNKTYDGNSLRSAGDHYGIAAESFTEIVRYEHGFNAALDQAAAILQDQMK